MGGNAISNVVRLNRDRYHQVERYVSRNLDGLFNPFNVTRSYYNKESFGDMDVIVGVNKPEEESLNEILFNTFNANEIVHNGDSVSFALEIKKGHNFQIDLIFVDPSYYETARFYFSHNDLNNIVGGLAHKLGLKFGWDGLSLPVRSIFNNNHCPDVISISKDPLEIYSFLDLNYDEYLLGFENLEDIFKFVSRSKYFNKEIFTLENSNNKNRTRNRKRPTYMAFLEWLKTAELPHDDYVFSPKRSYLNMINDFFPNAKVKEKLLDWQIKQMDEVDLKEKWNGDLVMDWVPTLKGQLLGAALKGYPESKEDFNGFIKNNKQEDIKEDFLQWIKR